MPELERCGWIPVRTTPQDEPTRALRVAVVLNTLPRPDAERHALGEILTSWATDSEPTLDHLRQHYSNLEPKDARKRAWIAPYYALLSQSERGRGRGEWGEYTPYICRMLRAGWSPEEYGRYLGGLLRCGHAVADRSTVPCPSPEQHP
jgi:hypothetical protein